jgi:hypothetical protein
VVVYEKSSNKRPLERPKYRWDDDNDDNKIDVTEVDISLRRERSGGCCEQGNESSTSIQREEIF